MAGYSCVAENKVGTIEKLFSLTVQGKPPPKKNPKKVFTVICNSLLFLQSLLE